MTLKTQPCPRTPILFIAILLFACEKEQADLVIVSKALKQERATSTAVPDEFSSFAPASMGNNYRVEGTVKNVGKKKIIDVVLIFKGHDGNETRVLTAEIKEVSAGQTVNFKTRILQSKYSVKLLDEEPEISYETR